MVAYKSIVAYDGTEFQGFQRQGHGLRTVQAAIEDALGHLRWQGHSIKAAGRTDAGVHAQGQVIAFELAWKHETKHITQALNANLPSDVSVFQTEVAEPDFHPRFSALRRRYRYTLIAVPMRDPLRERYAWRIWPPLNFEVLKTTAGSLVGRRNFSAFGKAPVPGGDTERQVFKATWRQECEVLFFEIEANAFLYRMVRRLVGAMIEVGKGRVSVQEVEALLDDPSRRWEGPIAKAHGLCLQAVIYPDERPKVNHEDAEVED